MEGAEGARRSNAAETLARNVVLVACAASAGVHGGLVPSHLAGERATAVAFAVAVAALAAVTVSLARAGDPRRPAAAAAALLAGLIAAYALSRTVGLAPLEEDVERVDAIGVLTQAIQAAGLVAALFLCQPAGDALVLSARKELS